jgi:hypothetical protein
MMRLSKLLPFLTALVASCGDDALQPARECLGPMAVTVSAEPTPLFTWTVPCAASRLVVLATPSGGAAQIVWDVRSDPPGIVSPVRYAQRPGGTTEAVAPATLTSGATYQVRVYSAAQVAIGTASFVP